MNPLESITFDTTNYEYLDDIDREDHLVRAWFSPASDGVGLYYFNKPPNIKSDLTDVTSLRHEYRQTITSEGHALIELETMVISDCRAIRIIVKVPQQNLGMIYLASLTFPFQDFSYVLKIQCEDRDLTGIREAVVLDQLFASGELPAQIEGVIPGWMQDPYDASIKAPFMMNCSEMQKYDHIFPDHPLSRARSFLTHAEATINIAPEVRNAHLFKYQKN